MIEYDQPGYLNTPIGDLLINQETEVGWFMVDTPNATPQPLRPIRATKDSVPQGDGDILHRRYTNGTELTIPIQMWKTIGDPGEPACGKDLRLMLETLAGYMQAILNGRGRWFWTPSGYSDDRMLDECRWLVPFSRSLAGKLTTVTFGIDSPFPCFIDAMEVFGSDTIITPSQPPVLLINEGNHEAYPVIEVLGTFTAFTVTNESLVDQNGNPLTIVYDGETVTTPDFAEIDVFRNTIYLNGNQDNLKSGIDAEETDYFFLRPGENAITTSGAEAQFKYNHSWVPA